jgi:hypothetical protein
MLTIPDKYERAEIHHNQQYNKWDTIDDVSLQGEMIIWPHMTGYVRELSG